MNSLAGQQKPGVVGESRVLFVVVMVYPRAQSVAETLDERQCDLFEPVITHAGEGNVEHDDPADELSRLW
jgi:hypothetical protein